MAKVRFLKHEEEIKKLEDRIAELTAKLSADYAESYSRNGDSDEDLVYECDNTHDANRVVELEHKLVFLRQEKDREIKKLNEHKDFLFIVGLLSLIWNLYLVL
jgi:uncharacterized membrane-anchored protein YhcB (DUF1043 family)